MMVTSFRRSGLLALLLLLVLALPGLAADVYRIHLDGAVHPVSSEYIVRAIKLANDEGSKLILLQMNTPGGFISSTEEIQKAILQSKAPVVVYVAPSGSRAASAGALIALASDLIAMAPGTQIGAAHPISGMPGSEPEESPTSQPSTQPSAHPLEPTVMMQKVVNDLSAHVRTLAENRGRNGNVAEQMVRRSLSLTEKEALEQNVVELIARDEGVIFAHLDENGVRRFEGDQQTMDLGSHPEIRDVPMNVRESFLSALADPSLAYILLLLGVGGLVVEFKSPGMIFPGVLGGICLLLYAISIPLIPINVVGLLLILMGIAFLLLEVKVSSYGVLGIGGVVAIFFGSVMLYSGNPIPELRLSYWFVLPIVLAFAGIVLLIAFLAMRAMARPVKAGMEHLVGQEGDVRQAIAPPDAGQVFVFGEYWAARSTSPLAAGQRIRVVAQEGMTLQVEPAIAAPESRSPSP